MEGSEGNSGGGGADGRDHLTNASTSADGGGTADTGNNPAKRHARVGQWRTPPVPFFPSNNGGVGGPPPGAGAVGGTGAGTGTGSGTGTGTGTGVAMPGSESEYARALQEAYRQGAAAAATGTASATAPAPETAAGGSGGMGMGSHAASCPDLGSLQPASLLPPSGGSFGTLASVGEEEELVEEPDPQQQQQWHLHANVSPSYHQAMVGPSGVPTPLPLGPMRIPGAPPVPGAQAGQPPFGYPGGGASSSSRRHAGATPGTPPTSSSGGGGKGRPPAGGRSVSMPDISSYAAQQDAEEAKRRKRLARNRASARLRRLKKKNLVSRVHSLVVGYDGCQICWKCYIYLLVPVHC